MHNRQNNQPVRLIPGGCLQFLDLEFNIAELPDADKFRRYFFEYGGDEGRPAKGLLSLDPADKGDGFIDRFTGKPAVDPEPAKRGFNRKGIIRDPQYVIKQEEAVETFIDQWIPLPVFQLETKASEFALLGPGPSNWARGRLSRIVGRDDTKMTHALTVVFDTQVETALDTQVFHALTPEHVADNAEFVLAHHERQCGWFVRLEWVDKWLRHICRIQQNKALRKRQDWEHAARYLSFLDILHRLEVIPHIKIVNVTGEKAIPVDLVLDVGNSRTCGILVERFDEEKYMGLNDIFGNTYVLELRNLSEPHRRYREPFASRVEFSLAGFGDPNQYANASGRRTEAFSWPTPVRIGPEANQLGLYSRSEAGRTGMSSPKRYLWDQYARPQQWRFNSGPLAGEELPVIRGPYALYINDLGTPLRPLEEEEKAALNDPVLRRQMEDGYLDPVTDPRFSRSSLMMFMLSEIIAHALLCINAPEQRQKRPQPHLPRQLRRVVLTMPTAMTIAERKIFSRWAEWAVEMVWQAMDWWTALQQVAAQSTASPGNNADPDMEAFLDAGWWREVERLKNAQDIETLIGYRDYRIPPSINCECDEASATQLVYLANEIIQKFRGDADALVKTFGRQRSTMPDFNEVFRVASIDVGGGTTDLMITTYGEQTTTSATVITPRQEFREGFNIAGDDIVKAVIEQHVLRSLKKAVSKSGAPDPKGVLTSLLGGDFAGQNQTQRDRFLRYQFATQVAVPIALEVLRLYEQYDPLAGEQIFTMEFGEFFTPPHPPGEVISFIDNAVRRAGGRDFSLQRLELEINMQAIDQTVRNTLDPILGKLSEIIHLYDCDMLLLSGRPSRFPAIKGSILSKMPLPPNRIVPMHDYRIGDWYPFRNVNNRIPDPKTTTSIGAILHIFSEGYLERFQFDSTRLTPRSTCRFMGALTMDGFIKAQDVFFGKPLDLDSRDELEIEHDVDFYAPMFIGFRQLASQRWPATPFYRMVFNNSQAIEAAKGNLPYRVKLIFKRKSKDDDNLMRTSDAIGDIVDEGSIGIEEVCRADGEFVQRGHIDLRLQTLKSESEEGNYWLDTGIFKII